VPPEWGYDPIEKEKKRLHDLLNAIMLLRSDGVHRAGVVGAYHVRGVAPLMARTILLYEMMSNTPLKGIVLARVLFCNNEIEQRIREAMDALGDTFKFLISGHPTMHPDAGFIDLVSFLPGSFTWLILCCRLILRTGIRSLASSSEPSCATARGCSH
jgi:hypothetical protein